MHVFACLLSFAYLHAFACFFVCNLSLDGSDLNAKINEVVNSRLRNTGQGEFILLASAVKENRSYLDQSLESDAFSVFC